MTKNNLKLDEERNLLHLFSTQDVASWMVFSLKFQITGNKQIKLNILNKRHSWHDWLFLACSNQILLHTTVTSSRLIIILHDHGWRNVFLICILFIHSTIIFLWICAWDFIPIIKPSFHHASTSINRQELLLLLSERNGNSAESELKEK